MQTPAAVQRAEEKTLAIKPLRVEDLPEKMSPVFDEIQTRAYEIFEQNGRPDGHALDNWLTAESELLQPVRLEVSESDGMIEVRAAMPGFNEGDIEICFEPQRLTIIGRRVSGGEEATDKNSSSERGTYLAMRILDLSTNVEANRSTATLKNGVLLLAMPKATDANAMEQKTRAA